MDKEIVHPQAYVALGQNGLLKVGMSKDAKRRALTLRRDFKAKGDALLRIHLCPRIEAAYSVESCLMDFCRKNYERHSGREWFTGGDFDTVVIEAERLTEEWKTHRYPNWPYARWALDQAEVVHAAISPQASQSAITPICSPSQTS